MKRMWMTLGLATAIAAGQAMPARAINKEWSAVAGFVGGVLAANAYRNTRCERTTVVYQQPVQTVTYTPVQTVIYQPVERVVVHEPPPPTGYYTWQTERVWVPGCWVYEDYGCGRRKVWQPGYYTLQRRQVWVDTSCRPGW